MLCFNQMNRFQPYKELGWGPRFPVLQDLMLQENHDIRLVSLCEREMFDLINLPVPPNLMNHFQAEKYLSIHPLIGIDVLRNH